MAWTVTKVRSGRLSATYLVNATGGLNENVTVDPSQLLAAGMRGPLVSKFLGKVFLTADAVTTAFASLGGKVSVVGANSTSLPRLGCNTFNGKPEVSFISSSNGLYSLTIEIPHSLTE